MRPPYIFPGDLLVLRSGAPLRRVVPVAPTRGRHSASHDGFAEELPPPYIFPERAAGSPLSILPLVDTVYLAVGLAGHQCHTG